MPQSKKNAVRSLDNNAFAIVREDETVAFLSDVDKETLYTLMSCVEDDARNWNDFRLDWERCTASQDSLTSIEELDWQILAIEQLADQLIERTNNNQSNWIVVDLPNATILTGQTAPILVFSGPSPGQATPDETAVIELNIAPWWKSKQSVEPESLKKRQPIAPGRLEPDREVLWGKDWVEFLSKELAKIARNGAEISARQAEKAIISIHKAWLMTPHPRLQNQTPREQIHFAKDWVTSLQNIQRYRIESGFEPIPLPMDFSGFKGAPFGKHEIIIYFDATRELLNYGYHWMLKSISSRKAKNFEANLNEAMQKRLKRWKEELDEENLSPALVIQFERQRVPLMELEVTHPDVCGCPICLVASSGALGPGEIFYDGHQLELDEEFAFSLYSTKEEWEEEAGYFSDSFPEDDDPDDDGSEDAFDVDSDDDSNIDSVGPSTAPPVKSSGAKSPDAGVPLNKPNTPDEFEARIWSTNTPEETNLSSSFGKSLGLSFLFAELMTEVDAASKSRSSTKTSLEKMMRELASLRVSLESQNLSKARSSSAEIKRLMEGFADEFPLLVPRVADLSSRLDGEVRKISTNH